MMQLHQLLEGLAPVSPAQDCLITGISSDSREIQPGDLFLAYPGLRVDGRNFIAQAIDRGAIAIVCEKEDEQSSPHHHRAPIIFMQQLQRSIGEIAARFYHHPSQTMKIIGVTGTNGKTSCTHFIAQILKCGVMGTVGYGVLPDLVPAAQTTLDPIHVQKILAQLKKQTVNTVAMEVTSHALDQGRVQGVHFAMAVFTQLSRDHLDYHADMTAYAAAKELLFQQPGLRYGVINLDDAFGQMLVDRYHKKLVLIGYSQSGKIDKRIDCISATHITSRHPGFNMQVDTPWGTGEFTTELLGRFNISNLLAVLGVLGLLNMPLPAILSALSQITTVRGRMQRLGDGMREPLVIIDYSHTPDALEKALTALREQCQGKLWCVFGCGGDRDRGKRPQMAAIAEQQADCIVLTNDNPRSESALDIINDITAGFLNPEKVTVLYDRKKAIQFAVQNAHINDIVLIAGKGHETVQIIGKEALPFDDLYEAKLALIHRA